MKIPWWKSVSWVKGEHGYRIKVSPIRLVFCAFMLLVVYRATNFRYQQAEIEARVQQEPLVTHLDTSVYGKVGFLPRGIVEARSELELKPLWLSDSSNLKNDFQDHQNLLAVPAGLKQKRSVDALVQKFIPENFTIILFHYDGSVNGWDDLPWSRNAIHVVAPNQTKWWFAKRFLHPDVVSTYDYVFIWDEDLGVDNFNPRRYLEIVKVEGLEISQPAVDADLSSEVHHGITIRRKKRLLHRRIKDDHGKCANHSQEPPCAGWVEGMAPVFSRSAWRCVWHLIQNDLVHGWGMDMKLGYCAQGDPRKKVGVVDSQYIVHQGIPTLGGSNEAKVEVTKSSNSRSQQRRSKRAVVTRAQRRPGKGIDLRVESRRRAKSELQIFQDRWDKAVKQDKDWINPFNRRRPRKRSTTVKPRSQNSGLNIKRQMVQ